MISETELRTKIIDDLVRFNAMTTQEYVLFQKWEEVNDMYPMDYSPLFDDYGYRDPNTARLVPLVKSLMWNEEEIKNLEPELLRISLPEYENIKDHWTALRVLIHTQQNSGSIGRGINYLVRDRCTKKYLGVVAIASDFLDLSARDDAIGWSREQRTQEQRIQHTAVCSTIVPVQPFGYNFLGGKLLALLCLSDTVQDDWFACYGSRLVGLTTTSLYGKSKGGHGMSQYDNLTYWKKMGYSSGLSPFRMSHEIRKMAFEWFEEAIPDQFYRFMVEKDDKGQPMRDRLNRASQYIYRQLKIPTNLVASKHDRGVYFGPLYMRTYEFLRDDIPFSDIGPKNGDYSISALTDLWKTKYAQKRYTKLMVSSKLSHKPLFYDDLSKMDWETARATYLSDVGR